MNETLYLPQNHSGFINHYHHFLMGYFLPVISDTPISSIGNTYFVDCGTMNTIIKEFGFLLKNETNIREFNETKQIKGLDGPENIIPLDFIETINSKVDQVLNITREDTETYILLIDRGPKVDNQYPTNPLGGAYRRTILNIDEVETSIKKFGIVKRCILENLSFKDQIKLFRNASCVIAQHGAGLSNLCFALKCKDLIEIVNTNNTVSNWFQNLADVMGIRKHNIVALEEDSQFMGNITLDIEKLDNCMKQVFNGV